MLGVVDTQCARRCVTRGVLGIVVDTWYAGRCCVTRGVLSVVDTWCAGRCVTHGVLGIVVDMRCAGRCCGHAVCWALWTRSVPGIV